MTRLKLKKKIGIVVVLGVLLCSILVSVTRLPTAHASNPQVNIGYYVYALATDGTYIYAASSNSSGFIFPWIYALSPSTLNVVAKGDMDKLWDQGLVPEQIICYNGYLYIIGVADSTGGDIAVAKFSGGAFSEVALLGQSALGMGSQYQFNLEDAAIYNGYLYAVGYSYPEAFGTPVLTLWSVQLSNLAVTSQITTTDCAYYNILINVVGGNLWVTWTGSSYIYEYSTALTEMGSFAFSDTNVGCMVTDGTYIYSISSSSSDYVWAFQVGTSQNQDYNAGTVCQATYPESAVYNNGYLYLASYSADDLMAFSTPGMQLLISESVSATGLDSVILNSAGTELYVGSDNGYVTEIPVSSIPTPTPTAIPTPTPTPTPAPTMTPTLPVMPTTGWVVANGASSVNAVSTSNWEYGSEPFMLIFPEGPDANVQYLNVPVAAVTGFSFQAEDGSSSTYAWMTYTFSDQSTASSSDVLVDSSNYQTFNLGLSGLTGKLPCYNNLNITAITMNYNSQSQSPIYINDVTLSYATPTSSEPFSLGYGGYQVAYVPVSAPAIDIADLSLLASGSGIGDVYVALLFNDGSYVITAPQTFNIIATLTFPIVTTDESAAITTVQVYANDSASQVTINDVSFDYPPTGGQLPPSPTPTPTSTSPPTSGTGGGGLSGILKTISGILKTLTSIWRKIPTLLQDLMTAFLVLMILLLLAAAANRRDKNKRTSRPRPNLRAIGSTREIFSC